MNAITLPGTDTAAPPVTMYTLGQKALVTGTNFGTKEAYAALMTLVPYGRIGEPEDSRAAIWLASDHSDCVVGTTIYVDGGMTLSGFRHRRLKAC
jgi:NAD(P)-dependent dehydrogenase (short-subunit alcohol dehydrogenase family)